MVSAALRTLAGLALAAFALAAAAQDVRPTLAPSPALRCLSPALAERGKPEYPEVADTLKLGATVEVELRFDGPAHGPAVELLTPQAGDDFVRAVRRHVRRLRVPCMSGNDAPVRLRQTYVFSPDGRSSFVGAPRDQADTERAAQLSCVRRVNPLYMPSYPENARRESEQGRVLLLLRFVSADGPPEVQAFPNRWNRLLSRHAVQWASEYRMPCFAGKPVEATWTFLYRLGDDLPPTFKDLDLLTFLRSVKDIRSQRLHFDFNPMGCPFDLRLTYFRPHLPNRVAQLDQVRTERQAFVDWLSEVELQLPARLAGQLLGDDITLRVPCTVVALEPSSPSPKKE